MSGSIQSNTAGQMPPCMTDVFHALTQPRRR